MAQLRTPHRSYWQKIRKLFNDIHLWLGLTSGLIVIVVCFSGTVYVYSTELTEMAAPHLYTVTPPAGAVRIPADSMLRKVEAASGGTITSVQVPSDPGRTYQYNVRVKGDNSRGGIAWFVDPYRGDITGNSKEKNNTREFMMKMFSLHRWLLLDKVEEEIITGTNNRKLGSMITGWATILFTLGCITGLVIWFPQKVKFWRQGLKIKWKAGWKRVNHDLHNTLAFYSLIFLLLMGLTGPQWSFEWYRTGLQKTLGTYKEPVKEEGRGTSGQARREGELPRAGQDRQEGRPEAAAGQGGVALKEGGSRTEAPGQRPAAGPGGRGEKPPGSTIPKGTGWTKPGIHDYMAAADRALLYEGNYTIMLPADSTAVVHISKTKAGFFAPAAADRLMLDQYSSAVLKKEIFRDKPFNERVAQSIRAIHVGNVYGGFTKLLYFLACLIATSLPVTGTMIWLNKMKKKKPLRHDKGKRLVGKPVSHQERQ